MPAIKGKLENIEELGIWGSCFRLEMKGIEFYKRRGPVREKKKLIGMIRTYFLQREMIINYYEEETITTDWILDRVLGLSYGIPRKHLEIISIALTPESYEEVINNKV